MDAWSTVSNLATGAGTLVLAVATFAAVRSSNRSARIAEAAFRQQMRPVLVHSALDDARQKIMFVDGHWVAVEGGSAAFELGEDVMYLAISLRNVGAGLAVLQSWRCQPRPDPAEPASGLGAAMQAPPLDEFRRLSRDLYVPAGGTGLWQGAWRDPAAAGFDAMRDALRERRTISVDLLYTDHVGGQRTISQFSVSPAREDRWLTGVVRHWHLDQPGPRSRSESPQLRGL